MCSNRMIRINLKLIRRFDSYTNRLRWSISKYKYRRLQSCLNNPNYYTYIIVNGDKLLHILEKFEELHHMGGGSFEALFEQFVDIIIYIGKGSRNRKITHSQELEKQLFSRRRGNKYKAKKILVLE